jgi:ABC-2 type transport system ATP-binding protein
VLLSSHLLAEVEELCNRVAIVRSGRIVYEGAIADLKRMGASGYRLRTTDDETALAVAAAQPGVENARRDGAAIRFTADEATAAQLSIALVEAGAAIVELMRETATLEDLFFRLTEGDEAAAPGALERSPA